MPFRMDPPSSCNHLEPWSLSDNIRGENLIFNRGDGSSAKGWVHEVGMYADVAIVWQRPVVFSIGRVDALKH